MTRRLLLVAASAAHAEACATRLGLHSDAWDYVADNSTFRLHNAHFRVVLCSGAPTDAQSRLLDVLGLSLHDAVVLRPDGSLHPLLAPEVQPNDG